MFVHTTRPFSSLCRAAVLTLGLSLSLSVVQAAEALDLGEQLPDAATLKEGLFPEDACKELEAAGYKCMGFKPAVRYSLPGTSFRVGSADLPDLLRRQLDVFAAALSGKKASGTVIRVEGHADASGAADANLALSQRRADAVKRYLVDKGTDAGLLEAVGMGTRVLKDDRNPFAPVNRRVEIGR